ncbi:MAG: sulfatase-like hydrolase/transferase, partial [Planctomycetes bacterium]|nr:sulfatase-like hydrolase/transferase [Planctomycetota bacterium]
MLRTTLNPQSLSNQSINDHLLHRLTTFILIASPVILSIYPLKKAFSSDNRSVPNIVFILADDLGYGDVNCFGGERCQIKTPNFDRLASQGMRFTDAHANASVCVPTRVAIMTGRYPWRFGKSGPGGPWGYLGTRLPVGQHTLGTMMRAAGYRTGYVGKWHLGTLMQTTDGKPQGPTNVDYTKPLKIGPPQFGFDDSFILPGSLDMYPYAFVRNNHWVGKVTAQK